MGSANFAFIDILFGDQKLHQVGVRERGSMRPLSNYFGHLFSVVPFHSLEKYLMEYGHHHTT